MGIERLALEVEQALDAAHARVRGALLEDPHYGVIDSYRGQPGLWETAEAIGIVHWEEGDQDLLATAVEAVLSEQQEDGGFAPWPDITSKNSYCESTTRVLLSLAPVCRSVAQPVSLAESVQLATEWLLENQDEKGGWGGRLGMSPRIFPTTFSIQALATVAKELDAPTRERCAMAISEAARWIERCQNEKDGGFGTRPGARSNVASSGHAAWGLSVAGAEVPSSLRAYILERLEGRLPSLIADKVDDPESGSGLGRYELLVLSRPMALIGAIAAHGHIYEERVVAVLKAILGRQSPDGVWRVDSGRFVWPTYMYVTALRLWLTVHRSHAQTSTSDFSGLGPGADLRLSGEEEESLYGRGFPLPPNWKERLERLSPRQRQAFVSDLKGESIQAGAEAIGIRPKTLEKHRYAARRRLEIKDGLEAWAIAVAGGLVQESDRDS